MFLEECHFEYGNFYSREYGLMFAHVDTSSITQLSGQLSSNTVFNKKSMTRSLIGTNYTESPMSFDIDIVTDDMRTLTQYEIRKIQKSLFNKPQYRRLYADMADDCMCESYEIVDGSPKRLYLNCRLMNPEKIETSGGHVVGFKCTVECDSCMLTQDAVEANILLDESSDESVRVSTVSVDTDINDYTYPNVTIRIGQSGGDITIMNNSDDPSRITEFVALQPGSVIVMNGNTNQINDDYYEHFSRQNFIRLLDGENNIVVCGDVASMRLEWSNRRFL